jgi:hypothetical protein
MACIKPGREGLPRQAQLPLWPPEQLSKRFADVLVEKAFDVGFRPALAGSGKVCDLNSQLAMLVSPAPPRGAGNRWRPETVRGRRDMSAGTDPRRDPGTDREVAFLDLFDPGFQPDAPQV